MAELYPLLPAAQDVLGELAEALERRASAGEPACVAPVRAGAGGRASPRAGRALLRNSASPPNPPPPSRERGPRTQVPGCQPGQSFEHPRWSAARLDLYRPSLGTWRAPLALWPANDYSSGVAQPRAVAANLMVGGAHASAVCNHRRSRCQGERGRSEARRPICGLAE
jgi:hypothetical protein